MDAGGPTWPRTNEESWEQLREFVAYLAGNPVWSGWVRTAGTILDALARDGLDRSFRIGSSMHDIMVSTLDHHGLIAEPRTTLTIDLDGTHVRVSYSRSNVAFEEPDDQVRVPRDEAVPVVRRYLEKLWRETKPDTPLPAGLAGV